MWTSGLRIWLVGLVAVVGLQCAHAKATQCANSLVTVEARDAGVAHQICSLAEQARPLLQRCYLLQSSPIHVVVGRANQSNNDYLGSFDLGAGGVFLNDPDALDLILSKKSIWRRIPIERLFQSLIVHELGHAVLQQSGDPDTQNIADHEYVAYSMQLSWLTARERESVLRLEGHGPREPRAYLNDFIAHSAPETFVPAVWAHFSKQENGCAFIRKLVEGTDTLHISPE